MTRWTAPAAQRLVRRENLAPAVGLTIALAVVVVAKAWYRDASAGQLAWILSPTAHLVSAVTGYAFSYEVGAGWVSRDAAFIIEPACAGVHFVLAAFLALAVGWAGGMRGVRAIAARLGAAAALAVVAAVLVNTVRLSIAIALHRGAIDLGGLDPAEVHRVEGIVVYLGGLCALYGAARAVERRRGHAQAA